MVKIICEINAIYDSTSFNSKKIGSFAPVKRYSSESLERIKLSQIRYTHKR